MKEEKIAESAEKKYYEIQDLLDDLADGYKAKKKYRFLFPNDLVDLMQFYLMVSNKEWEKAYNIFEKMDTDVREKISLLIYDFLAKKYGILYSTEKAYKK